MECGDRFHTTRSARQLLPPACLQLPPPAPAAADGATQPQTRPRAALAGDCAGEVTIAALLQGCCWKRCLGAHMTVSRLAWRAGAAPASSVNTQQPTFPTTRCLLSGWAPAPAGGVYTIHVQHTGRRFATGGADAQVKIWSMAPILDAQKEKGGGPLVLATLSDHSSTVNTVRFSKNGKFLASGAQGRGQRPVPASSQRECTGVAAGWGCCWAGQGGSGGSAKCNTCRHRCIVLHVCPSWLAWYP